LETAQTALDGRRTIALGQVARMPGTNWICEADGTITDGSAVPRCASCLLNPTLEKGVRAEPDKRRSRAFLLGDLGCGHQQVPQHRVLGIRPRRLPCRDLSPHGNIGSLAHQVGLQRAVTRVHEFVFMI
jgi:hypothetical protein